MKTRTDSYAFSNSASEASQQLSALEAYLDPVTIGVLQDAGIPPGGRCLEIGPGAGSMTRWLAERVGPTGRVTAVDLDTSKLTPTSNIDIYRYDVRDGLPDPGPYDLILARLVLLHLPARRQVLRTLVDALRPGGWLVIGEFSRHPLAIITTPSGDDAALFTKVTDTLIRVLEQHGADLDWAHHIHPAVLGAGLRHVHTIEHAESWTGGTPAARLHHINSLQKQDELLAAGLSETELARFRDLVNDPRFCARSWQFTCTRGQKPRPTR